MFFIITAWHGTARPRTAAAESSACWRGNAVGRSDLDGAAGVCDVAGPSSFDVRRGVAVVPRRRGQSIVADTRWSDVVADSTDCRRRYLEHASASRLPRTARRPTSSHC